MKPEHVFLLSEGILQPPPVLTQNILNWITSAYAQRVHEKLGHNIKYEEKHFDEMQDNMEKYLSYDLKSKILSELEKKMSMAESKSPNGWEVESFLPWGPYDPGPNDTTGKDWDWGQPFITVSKVKDLYGTYFLNLLFTFGNAKNAKMNDAREKKDGGARTLSNMGMYQNQEEILFGVDEYISDTCRRNWEDAITIERRKLDALGEISNATQPYIKEQIPNITNITKISKIFNIDLSGWKYGSIVNNPNTVNFSQKEFTVSLIFNEKGSSSHYYKSSKEDYAGIYRGFLSNPKDTIVVYAKEKQPEDENDFINQLNSVQETATHEIIHLAQDIMAAITNKYQAGYSSRHLNKNHKNDDEFGSDKPHVARDIEFYTRLNDAVMEFEKLSNTSLTPKGIPIYFKHYTGLSPDYKNQETTLYHSFKTRNYRTFWDLKEKDPPRWQNAVKEFYKALKDKGILV
jgi:hypothetical protein